MLAAYLTRPICVTDGKLVVLKNVNFADMDFNVNFVIEYNAKPPENLGTLVEGPPEFSWGISIDEQSQIVFRIGDRASWVFLCKICNVAEAGPIPIAIRRRGDTLHIESSEGAQTIALPRSICIPGNVLALGRNEKLVGAPPMSVRFNEISIHHPRPQALPADKDIDVISVFYGQTFCDFLTKVSFPSLYAHNLCHDAFARRRVVHNIYCTERELPSLQEHIKKLEKLGIDVHIDTNILDSRFTTEELRSSLFLCYADQLLRSIRDGRVVLFAPPDLVFGYGVQRCLERMEPLDYLVAAHPRMDMTMSLDILARRLTDYTPAFSDNAEFVNFVMKDHPHPMVRHGLSSPEPYWYGFDRGSHYGVYFKEPVPLLCDPSLDILNVMLGTVRYGAFEAIDHDIVDYTFAARRLKFVKDSSEFFWTELTNPTAYNPTIKNDYYTDAAKFFQLTEVCFRKQDAS